MKKQQEGGQAILERLNKRSDDEVKRIVSTILSNTMGEPDSKYAHLLGKEANVRRVVDNERVKEITLSHYDSILVSWVGIAHKPEHGPENMLVYFPAYIAITEFMSDN